MIPVRVKPGTPVHVVSRWTLTEDHPLYGRSCPACGELLGDGARSVDVALVYVGSAPDSGWTAGSVAVHATCVPQGNEPEGESA